MKQKTYCAVLGAVAALSFATVAVPMYAADSTTSSSDKSFGQIERANKLIGKTVYSSDNQKLGKIDNFVVDLESGRIIYAVVGTGVLGVGGKDYAVSPGTFTDVRGDTIHINVDKQKFTGAPEFTKDIDKNVSKLRSRLFLSFLFRPVRLSPNKRGKVGVQFRNILTGDQKKLVVE